jgi:glycosyltransferase involved in cell wall biosynthesis
MMRIIKLNANDIKGGAARAAYRIHKGLLFQNIDSKMWVQQKESDDFTVKKINSNFLNIPTLLNGRINKLPLKFFNVNEDGPWSINWWPTHIHKEIKKTNPDIVHLHWIGNNFTSIKDLGKIKKPIVWTLHDMWPFTGGFHYSLQCLNHEETFLSKRIWKKKMRYWKDMDLTIATPSNWLGKQAGKSELFKNKTIKVIPNGIDTETFKPIDKKEARNILNLSLDKKYILFGAMSATSDKRKGYNHLREALKIYKNKYKENNNVETLIFGASKPETDIDIGIKTNYLGQINDDTTLSLVYSTADVMVAPSLQDNLPNTVMESLSCGAPCVAFNIGGIPDMVDHKQNGYLATPYSSEDLAEGINWVLEDKKRRQKLSQNARQKVLDNFTLNKVASQYIELYKEIINNHGN